MELKLGMYARTEDGDILKIKNIRDIYTNDGIYLANVVYFGDCFHIDSDEIKKASYNIIDLIEVGDYVNGLQVVEVRKHLHNDKEIVLTNGEFNWSFSKNESDYKIKSIVTKEAFESMSYKVGE